ncbi:hypothetical protein ABDK56_03855, partial [Sphingomonas sp. ASV193]|uniref:hypothetical protein n=1 Tax=Sphingomonas sp. ASV193 TaxID=3144405 RepID=UPI0032E8E2E3
QLLRASKRRRQRAFLLNRFAAGRFRPMAASLVDDDASASPLSSFLALGQNLLRHGRCGSSV